jgi:hypothetical protein
VGGSLGDTGAVVPASPRSMVSASLERSLLFAFGSGEGIAVPTVAGATCSCLVLESATAPPAGCEAAMFARVVSESAAALLAGCSRVFNERGESGMRDAGGSTFAGIMVGFANFMARWARSRA